MFALQSFARSTFGELKGALVDDDEDEDEDDEAESNEGQSTEVLARSDSGFDKASLAVAPSPLQPLPTLPGSSSPTTAPGVPAVAEKVGACAPTETDGAYVANVGEASGPVPASASDEVIGKCSTRPSPISAADNHDRGAGDSPAGALPTPAASCPSSAREPRGEAELDADAPSQTAGSPSDALRDQAPAADEQLHRESAEAKRQFELLLTMPGLVDLLREVGAKEGKNGETCDFWSSATSPSVPQIAARCAEALRQLAPRALAADTNSDRHRLLASFSERYDTLFAQYEAVQQRCRDLTAQQERLEQNTQQVDTWKSAHASATASVEKLTLENADLRERIHALESRSADPREKRDLLQKLAQRDAEVRAAGDALRQLQDAVDDDASSLRARCDRLEKELQEVRRAACAAQDALESHATSAGAARDAAATATAREEAMAARCRRAEQENHETSLALEALLLEKEKRLEEREYLVDRRLVISMLALYQDYLASGEKVLAHQVLGQALQVLGHAEVPVAERRRVLAAASPKIAPPLADAFVDFLSQEVSEPPPDSGAEDAEGS
mmetsp:Transcript_95140/g.268806  ORF Transcript_95140/g.268806 Transcript_95140/m.268806 type:complete len:561 (-) Transcript_95140:59-1741(-)